MTPRSGGVPPARYRSAQPRTRIPTIPSRVYAAFIAAAAVATLHAVEPVAISGSAMGTTWSVKFVQPSPSLDAARTRRQISERLEELEQMLSTYRPGSELSRFNASRSTDWMTASREVVLLADEARQVSAMTGGAFDATVAPLVDLWGFGPSGRRTALPSNEEVARARTRVNWQRLEFRPEPPALRKREPALAVDFSSIAKGYAADALGELMRSLGATGYLIQVGGDIRTGGKGPDGVTGWRIGVEEPRAGPVAIAFQLELTGEALSTSGDYRNFTTLGGVRHGHIIDPRTGRPASSALAAVSVVHASAAWSSALATALFVLGPEEGLALARREKLACVFFLRDGEAFVRQTTPEFARFLR